MFTKHLRANALGLALKLVFFGGTLQSCGQSPAFTESGVAGSSTGADATGTTQSRSEEKLGTSGDSGTGEASGGMSGGTTSGGGSSGANTGGTSSGGYGTAGGGDSSNVWTPPADYPRDTPKENVLKEDGGTLDIPGVKAVKVGVNFEDLSDFDLNDSVLCFTGGFKVENRIVTSYKKQTITADVWNNSACGHFIHVQIKNKAGVVTQQFKYNDRVTRSATLEFDIGSTLFVVMENFPDSECIGPIGMNHPNRVEVAPNICRR